MSKGPQEMIEKVKVWIRDKKRQLLLNKMRYYGVVILEDFQRMPTKVIRHLFGYQCPKCGSKNYVSCDRKTLQPYNRWNDDFIHEWKECWSCGYVSGTTRIDWLG